MRLGRNEPEEIFALLPVLNSYPIREIMVHPRTGVQMYTGEPDLDIFEKCLSLSRCPVIYNGDITSLERFTALTRRFPSIGTWMVGRGLLCNPFLPAELKGIAREDVNPVASFRNFHDTLYQRFAEVRNGPGHLIATMKGYWSYFSQFFGDGDRLLKKIRKCQQADQYQRILEVFFESAVPCSSAHRAAPAAVSRPARG